MADQWWEMGYFVETQSGKSRFIKIGSARPRDDGGFWLNFDSLPIPTPDRQGNVRVSAVVQPQKGSYQQQGRSPAQPTGSDNEVPF